jgi:putative FmdB family regulatory protein
MPTYDYACRACGAEHEIFHAISDPPKRKCPSCGKLKLERRISAGAGILFKGSGFYQTDYRSDAYKAAAKAESGEGSAPKPAAAEGGGGESAAPKAESSTAKSESAPAKPSKPSKKRQTG